MAFYFKNFEKDNIMTEEDEEDFTIVSVKKILNLIKLEIIVI